MKKIIINDSNIDDKDIDYSVVRVKAIIVNSENSVIMEHNNNTFQLPGGHVEQEDLKEALKREILEECGISNVEIGEPFLNIVTYDNDYFGSSKKVLNKIYYFDVYTDETPDFKKTRYDILESKTPFRLFYVDMNKVKDFIEEEKTKKNIEEAIARELNLVFDAYKYIKDDEII
ncbi:MAG: NUDIX domain-containing protein [Bacilli bacterium]|nr:NUDIX domain-containing protein [Bacilli bacterium]